MARWCNGKAFGLAISRSQVQILLEATLCNNLRQVVYTYVPLSPSSLTWYRPKGGDALRLGRQLQAWRKVMAAYRWVDDLTVNCRLTACTPGSAPGPTLGIEYGKPLPLPLLVINTELPPILYGFRDIAFVLSHVGILVSQTTG